MSNAHTQTLYTIYTRIEIAYSVDREYRIECREREERECVWIYQIF